MGLADCPAQKPGNSTTAGGTVSGPGVARRLWRHWGRVLGICPGERDPAGLGQLGLVAVAGGCGCPPWTTPLASIADVSNSVLLWYMTTAVGPASADQMPFRPARKGLPT